MPQNKWLYKYRFYERTQTIATKQGSFLNELVNNYNNPLKVKRFLRLDHEHETSESLHGPPIYLTVMRLHLNTIWQNNAVKINDGYQ